MKKKLLTVLLAVALLLSVAVPAWAAQDGMSEAEEAAWKLYRLGLFMGTGVDENGCPIFDLDKAPTRAQGITMLVRLLGKEEEALVGKWETPFTDVPEWAAPYVGCAFANGLANGVGNNLFAADEDIPAHQYVTMVLRSLGYDSASDFRWDDPWPLSDQIGLTHGDYSNASAFTRGDVAIISCRALNAKINGTSKTLGETLSLPVPADSVSLDQSDVTLSVGDSLQLTATIAPADADTNNAINWTSSDALVASVSSTGLVTACEPGSAVITATLPDNITQAACRVTVEKPTVKIILRDSLPKTLNAYNYKNEIRSSWSVTDFRYEVKTYENLNKNTAYIYFSGTKTYDANGSGQAASCRISWQLFDGEGYVVDSGTALSPSVREGEKFKDAKGYIIDIAPGTYYLEISSTNW